MELVVPAFIAALVSGLFLIGAYVVDRRSKKRETEANVWLSLGNPVLNSADDLAARLFDIMVRRPAIDLTHQLATTGFEVYDPPKEVSTVWRFARFLATAMRLERQSASVAEDSRLHQLRFYISNKARMAMKGNLSGAPFKLQTEGQQLIGARVLRLSQTESVHDVDFYDFISALKQDTEIQDAADACRRFLDFRTDLAADSTQRLSVTLLCIYMIDALQDLAPTSKWEEFRVFLVSVVRARNRASASPAIFLYRNGDLNTDCYMDTFNFLPEDKKLPSSRRSRIEARNRGAFDRRVDSSGVTRTQGRDTIFLPYNGSPGDVLNQLRRVFPSASTQV